MQSCWQANQPTSQQTKGHGWNIHSLAEIIKNVCKWVFTCHYKRGNIYRIVVHIHGHNKTQQRKKALHGCLVNACDADIPVSNLQGITLPAAPIYFLPKCQVKCCGCKTLVFSLITNQLELTPDNTLSIWNKILYQTRLVNTKSFVSSVWVLFVATNIVTWSHCSPTWILRFKCLAQGHFNLSCGTDSVFSAAIFPGCPRFLSQDLLLGHRTGALELSVCWLEEAVKCS